MSKKLIDVLIFILAIIIFMTSDSTTAKAAPDVPSFWEVNDGNLRYNGSENIQGANVHFYECDISRYNNYFDRYLQKLNGYPFQLTARATIDERNSIGLAIEERAYLYFGLKNAEPYISSNSFDEIYNAHLEISAYSYENVMLFFVVVANGLTYNPRDVGKNVLPNPGIIPHNTHRRLVPCFNCKSNGTILCSSCHGAGEKDGYISTPQYGGIKPGQSSMTKISQTCLLCRGTGKRICLYCRGTGYR